ncbi:hypothetical protein RN001_010389 [Aquatica leii]|uniref:Uncharacterized protein n=1 Tax=Aquatica leii TaxID=1421715 RepID=A0AAN7P7U6_9COLE|nr:hypothetical protein RN001_010389 [Aquatica leii]
MYNAKTVILAACVCFANSGKLPSDIKVCKHSDPNLNECFKDAIPSLSIDAGSESMKVVQNYKNMKIYDLTNSVINSAKLEHDGDNIYAEFQVTIPLVRGESDYTVDGKILMLPIKGEGQCTMVFKDSKATLKMNGTKFNKNGKSYLNVSEFKVNFEPKVAEFNFDNLFNGDKKLGDAMNTLINENWRGLFEEVKEGYEETFGQLFKQTTNSIFTKISVDELFPQ